MGSGTAYVYSTALVVGGLLGWAGAHEAHTHFHEAVFILTIISAGRYLEARDDHIKPLFMRHDPGAVGETDGQKLRLTPRSVQLIVSRYSRMCGLPVRATPHTLRHTFATDLLGAGADIRSVQEMLGHESIRTTQVYTHVTDRQLREVHRAFHGRVKPAAEEDVPAENSPDE